MSRYGKKQDRPQAVKVDIDKSEIRFSITFTGTLDWNRDFAGDGIDNFFNAYQDSASDFHKALQRSLAHMVFDRAEGVFDNAKMEKLSATSEVKAAFGKWIAEHSIKNRKALEDELAETEARRVELQKRLGKTG